MPEKMTRKQFLKTLAVFPAVLAARPVLVQESTNANFVMEIQVAGNAPFVPDAVYSVGNEFGWIGEGETLKKTTNAFAFVHYVLHGIEYKKYYRYGTWVPGDVPRFVVMELL